MLSEVGASADRLLNLLLHFDLVQSVLQFDGLALLGFYLLHFFLLELLLVLWRFHISLVLLLLIILLHKRFHLVHLFGDAILRRLLIIIASLHMRVHSEALLLRLLEFECGDAIATIVDCNGSEEKRNNGGLFHFG